VFAALKEPPAGERGGPDVQQGERVQVRRREVVRVVRLEVDEGGTRVATGPVLVLAQEIRRVRVAYRSSGRCRGPAQLLRLRLPHQRVAVQIAGLVSLACTRPCSASAFKIRGVFEFAIPVDLATA
jgi:hypothetical protein